MDTVGAVNSKLVYIYETTVFTHPKGHVRYYQLPVTSDLGYIYCKTHFILVGVYNIG